MGHQSGIAGKSTREMAAKRRKIALWIGLGGLGLLLLMGIFVQYSSSWGLELVGFFILLFGFPIIQAIIKLVFKRKIKETKRAIRGAKAEEKVGELLERLSEDFYVLNDVQCPFGNIDHIVISKNGGVFLLETKAHGGKVEISNDTLFVNGKLPEKDFISQTLQNTYWLRDTINQITGSKPWITPVIVFTNAFVVESKPVKGVKVVNKKYLYSLLHSTNRSSTNNTAIWEQISKIKDFLRNQPKTE